MSRPPPRVDLYRDFVAATFTGRAVLADGSLAFFENGLIHRADGNPAREFPDGSVMYYEFSMLHRDNGPAVIHADGRTEYWHRGRPCHAHEGGGAKEDGTPRRAPPPLLASKPY